MATEWIKSGREQGVNCEIGFFESQKDPLLKRMYALETSTTVEEALQHFPASVRLPASPSMSRAGGRVSLRVLAA